MSDDNHGMYDELIPKGLYDQQEAILAECFALIIRAGLLHELSENSRDFLSESKVIQKFIQTGEGPTLDLRLSIGEYRQHLMRIMEVPPAQFEFLNFIIKTCYMMMLAEKNPLVAQELRGILLVSDTLKGIMGP